MSQLRSVSEVDQASDYLFDLLFSSLNKAAVLLLNLVFHVGVIVWSWGVELLQLTPGLVGPMVEVVVPVHGVVVLDCVQVSSHLVFYSSQLSEHSWEETGHTQSAKGD